MLETAVDITRRAKSTSVQDARFANDLVILSDAGRRSVCDRAAGLAQLV
jgi:hypothetical protein